MSIKVTPKNTVNIFTDSSTVVIYILHMNIFDLFINIVIEVGILYNTGDFLFYIMYAS